MDKASGTWVLPAYSPAIDTPNYTPEPTADEERLQISGRLPLTREQTGVFVERTKHVTLALTNQVPNCKVPAYGRGAVVQGAISPVRLEGITSVEVKLEAVLALTMTSVTIAGETLLLLFSEQEVLFGKSDSSVASDSKPTSSSFSLSRKASRSRNPQPTVEEERCPSTLTFAIRIPKAYSHEGILRALPPSYTDHFKGVPGWSRLLDRLITRNYVVYTQGLHLDSRYTLFITINRKGRLGRDKKTVVTQPIVFAPRSRPAQPALSPSLSFLSTLKSSPEEWKLFEAETAVREGHCDTDIISSALLLPRSQVFPMSHAIPFHLQLSCASAKSLAQYAPHGAPSPRPSSSHSLMFAMSAPSMHPRGLRFSSFPPPKPVHKKNERSSVALDANALGESSDAGAQGKDVDTRAGKTSGRIYLSVQRHVAVEFRGQWLLLKKTLGTSTFKRCPTVQKEAGNASVAWEGHVHVLGESKCGGFGGPGVRVKDYILLSVIPPDTIHAPLQEIHHLIPIRFTTDPYSEDIIMPEMELAHHTS